MLMGSSTLVPGIPSSSSPSASADNGAGANVMITFCATLTAYKNRLKIRPSPFLLEAKHYFTTYRKIQAKQLS
jgi:hypothetical protein